MDLVMILESLRDTLIDGTRVIRPIFFGNRKYFILVQAGEECYSTPKRDLPYFAYKEFEVLAGVPKEDVPVRWLNEYTHYNYQFGYVPKTEIENLIIILHKKYGMDLLMKNKKSLLQ